jgi:putative ABC transport system permease protein
VQPAGVAPEALVTEVRAALTRVDPERRPTRIRTMNEIARDATARPRFRAILVAAFALLALTLASVGVFGILTQTIQQKTRELALRMTFGARTPDIIRIIGSGMLRVAVAGVVIGLGLAAVFTRWLTTLLYGVSPFDPLTIATALAVLAVTTVVAASAPTWRALRIEPAAAFRQE